MRVAAHGGAVVRGRIRVEPRDFEVDEELGFAPDDHGTHVLLHVEKCGANTAWVASQLARRGALPVNDVGFSGLKDRRALTRQWFSVPETRAVAIDDWRSHEGDGYRVLEARRHTRKLRRGSHRGNRFRLTLRDLSGPLESLEPRLEAIRRIGVPNYFGAQRFGRGQGNLQRARDWASSGRGPSERQQRGFALSAARSELFNQVLAERVQLGNWNTLLPGEAIVLDGRQSFFTATGIDAALEARCASLDLHPSAPLHGSGESPARGVALELEARVLGSEPELTGLLEQQGFEAERRATRLVVHDLAWRLDGDVLELRFALGRGSFATTVLAELVADLGDETPAIE
jgi:tRNA pseudouridine13 synthase